MSIQHYENIIQEKRRKTPFREFVQWIASRMPVMLYRRVVWTHDGVTTVSSTMPDTPRSANIVDGAYYTTQRSEYLKRWRPYDFSLEFFENLANLSRDIPVASRFIDANSTDADHAASVWMSNKVYLSILAIDSCENILYTFYVQDHVSNVLNSVMVWDHCDNVYFSSGIIKSYNILYSRFITDSANIWFSTDLIWCSECIFCDGLQNQSYCIANKVYEREIYFREKAKILRMKSDFLKFYQKLPKKGSNFGSKDIRGKFCIYSESVENGFFSYHVKDGRNIFFVWDKDGRKNVYDTICSDQQWEGGLYGCINLGTASNCYLSDSFIGHSLYYCYNCQSCSFCLDCIGLKNQSYCILNQQYTKEEWEVLAEQIFASMERDGTLGEFFPATINPFYFNDTLAYLIDDSFTKSEVEALGYLWRDDPIRVDIPEWLEVVKSTDLDGSRGIIVSVILSETKDPETYQKNWMLRKLRMTKPQKQKHGISIHLSWRRWSSMRQGTTTGSWRWNMTSSWNMDSLSQRYTGSIVSRWDSGRDSESYQ
jgi:hypothetical protein